MTLTLNTDRLLRELHELAAMTDCPQPAPGAFPAPATAVTRVVFTRRDLQARAWLKSLASAAGFSIREDAVGNTFIRWPGAEPTLPAVGTGSHTDAIPHAGMYDGTVGVLGGLEALRALKESGFTPRRSLELLMFTSEEPTRFGIGCLGSRLLGGVLSPVEADALPDRLAETEASAGAADSNDPAEAATTHHTLRDVRSRAGFTGDLATVKLPHNHYVAWVELHIEQGPLLEREARQSNEAAQTHTEPLGIVTHIAAPASFRYQVEGLGGHAGALLMPDRRDALCAAAELILSVERHARAANAEAAAAGHSGIDTVATVGMLSVHPGAVNSVPSRVSFTLDIRDTDVTRRDQVMAAFHADISAVRQTRGVTVTEEKINADAPAVSDPHILETLESICQAEQIPFRRMVSRAYHDTSFMAQVAPVAMLFIPCRGGVSHRPDEYSTPSAIARGVRVLALALRSLASQ